MGYDWGIHKRKRRTGRRNTVSENPYIRLLVKLFRYLSRRTESKYNEAILKRLYTSKINRAPVSTSFLAHAMKSNPKKVAVVVGNIVDDPRKYTLPKLNVCALHVSEKARARIIKAGGKIYTLDQLALKQPTGAQAVLLRGVRRTRSVRRHYGIPGHRHSKTIPKVQAQGRKFEKARGRRPSRAFKV